MYSILLFFLNNIIFIFFFFEYMIKQFNEKNFNYLKHFKILQICL